MKMTGHYADPTAWEAIARADKKPQQVTGKVPASYRQVKRPRVGTYHAPNAKTTDKAVRLFRPENISIFARIRMYEVQHHHTGA